MIVLFCQRREELNEKWRKLDLDSNLDSFESTNVIDSESHTVTVTDFSSTDFIGSSGYHLGKNQVQFLKFYFLGAYHWNQAL